MRTVLVIGVVAVACSSKPSDDERARIHVVSAHIKSVETAIAESATANRTIHDVDESGIHIACLQAIDVARELGSHPESRRLVRSLTDLCEIDAKLALGRAAANLLGGAESERACKRLRDQLDL